MHVTRSQLLSTQEAILCFFTVPTYNRSDTLTKTTSQDELILERNVVNMFYGIYEAFFVVEIGPFEEKYT